MVLFPIGVMMVPGLCGLVLLLVVVVHPHPALLLYPTSTTNLKQKIIYRRLQ